MRFLRLEIPDLTSVAMALDTVMQQLVMLA